MIARAERLIVALDVASAKDAQALVERLGEAVRFYKVGLELFMAGGYFELVDWIGRRGARSSSISSSSTCPRRCGARSRPARARRHIRHRARQSGDDGGGGAREGAR